MLASKSYKTLLAHNVSNQLIHREEIQLKKKSKTVTFFRRAIAEQYVLQKLKFRNHNFFSKISQQKK
jgi:hypothetical protein